ncbi:DNA-binding response regulator, NarL/FixJ family, contains REC and HTH domains [Pustulibacterium marinum]|uniref:DNA-binding response regulator, NarL/FixJ family, contains REC and HTH domains n=1 Tax=Pustulibacterium marinum TaxID=1224947 RepID=A0A1I7FBB4_9FLAO|nr:response regulator transcription factor [Pustulibacterium marinum]SFU33437.1 DNA-binding response regulator, NarL/FixJ family, contains REC and HTH domains [Pustulibacterium marinum]
MIKVSVVDDHKLFRESLVMLLESFDDIEVVYQANDGKEFFELLAIYEDRKPDIILLDIQMPRMNGFEVCEKLIEEYPGVKIIIVSQLTTRESIHKVMDLGAHGFFTKNSDPEELEEIIKSINGHEFYLGRDLHWALKELLENGDKTEMPLHSTLSDREIDIIKLAAKEMNSIQIADELSIHARTVDTHKKRIMEKTNSKNFVGAIVYALRNGFFTLTDI